MRGHHTLSRGFVDGSVICACRDGIFEWDAATRRVHRTIWFRDGLGPRMVCLAGDVFFSVGPTLHAWRRATDAIEALCAIPEGRPGTTGFLSVSADGSHVAFERGGQIDVVCCSDGQLLRSVERPHDGGSVALGHEDIELDPAIPSDRAPPPVPLGDGGWDEHAVPFGVDRRAVMWRGDRLWTLELDTAAAGVLDLGRDRALRDLPRVLLGDLAAHPRGASRDRARVLRRRPPPLRLPSGLDRPRLPGLMLIPRRPRAPGPGPLPQRDVEEDRSGEWARGGGSLLAPTEQLSEAERIEKLARRQHR